MDETMVVTKADVTLYVTIRFQIGEFPWRYFINYQPELPAYPTTMSLDSNLFSTHWFCVRAARRRCRQFAKNGGTVERWVYQAWRT